MSFPLRDAPPQVQKDMQKDMQKDEQKDVQKDVQRDVPIELQLQAETDLRAHQPEPAGDERRDEWLTPDFGYTLRGLVTLVRQRSQYQLVEMLHSPTFGRVLRLDGAMQCSERDEFFYHEPLVHMAMAHAPARDRVLIIGGGDGGAAEEALKWRDLDRLQHVEIDALVLDLCRQHMQAVHHGVLDGNDSRYRLQVGDGSAWLAHTGAASVDVLVLDLTDAGGPSSPLYDSAFYRRCAAALTPAGVLSLHIAAPWTQFENCRRTLRRLRAAFAVVKPFVVSVPMSGGQWLMALASNGPALGDGSRRLPDPGKCLAGPALQCVDAQSLRTAFHLPPYLQEFQR